MNDLITRKKKAQEFEENVWFCERTEELICSIEESRKGTRIYRDMDLITEERLYGGSYAEDNVCKEKANDLLQEERDHKRRKKNRRIGIACFVSAYCPGGNVIRGGSGIEEYLCRQSTLYLCLNTDYLWNEYYRKNEPDNNKETARKFLYIPNVICTDKDDNKVFMKQYGNCFDVICCGKTENNIERDVENMLMIAREQKIDVLIFLLDARDGAEYLREGILEDIKTTIGKDSLDGQDTIFLYCE